MFTMAQFTIAKLWNQPKYLPTDDLVRKMWYIYKMEFCLAIKKNESMSFSGKWLELEIIMLNKISQSHIDKYCMFSLTCES
jgi:hypothetical protein